MTAFRELALALRAAGVRWTPRPGDRFTLVDPAFADDVYTIAEMVVELQDATDAQVLGFNGTTEWALDSVDFADAVWLPREDQLRDLLGPMFRRLERTADGYAVTVHLPGRAPEDIPAGSAEDAYALAVLARLAAADAAAG
ncbi:pilus assembly protein CpaE [Nakamurella endophytica]|uniref:Pilus assembly protein CpaE n=1 Tax=Nakamurella endophytica TaxID=1748367 RepID=A0A917SSW4_9ACTN|nr:pilus assembly protein CpaE [Nakamurella endophytica]GGL96050.1 hypothetical protein GCM10011594_14710 [Nakamurella endophytica]